jgi:acetate---CoA ligase (ADP-forming) subunit beta
MLSAAADGPLGSAAVSASTTTLSEAASMALLASCGVAVVDEREVRDPAAAVEAAGAVGYPVVVKLCGAAIAHKTERGLVRLRLGDSAAVERAAAELLAVARSADGEVSLLVAPMVSGSRELIAGLVDDPTFGRNVMVGVGGILAEAVGDVAFCPVPLTRADAEDAIDALSTQALLGPFRGEPAVDRAALVDVLLGLSYLAERQPQVVAVDINPLIVVDGKPVAVDALVELVTVAAVATRP